MFFRTHPSYEKLSRLADGDLTARETLDINGHLASCERCREEVDFMIELRARLRELAVPGPPSSLLPDLLERREAGERRVLPLEDVEGPSGGRRRAWQGVAVMSIVMALALGSFLIFGANPIRAGSRTFEIESRGAARPLEVSFSTSGVLSGEPALRVRGEYYNPGQQSSGATSPGVVIEGDLESRHDGEFRGELPLPSSAAYARFVVEDLRGEVVDRDYGERWEYLQKGSDGLPTFDALWQRTLVLEDVAPGGALESARELVRLYPDQPQGWGYLASHRQRVGRDAEPVASEKRLERFVEALPANPDPDELAELIEYARHTGDPATPARLLSRLQQIAPRHPSVVRDRVLKLSAELRGNPRQLAASLEAEWRSHGQPVGLLLEAGLGTAVAIADDEAALRWADRWAATDPSAAAMLTRELASFPSLRSTSMERLRSELRRLDERPPPRALGTTRSGYLAAVGRRRAALLKTLGELLQAEGSLGSAADTLNRASALVWDPELLVRLASLSETLGRPDAAERYRLLQAADPLLGDADRRTIEEATGLDRATFDTRLAAARVEMIGELLGSGRNQIYPQGPIPVRALDGGPRDLGSRLGHRTTIVQFWTPLLPGSVDKLETLIESCPRLESAGVRLIAVSVDRVTPADVPDGAESCPALDVLVDTGQEALLSFRTATFSEAVVLDAGGQVRARFVRAGDVLRAALALAAIG